MSNLLPSKFDRKKYFELKKDSSVWIPGIQEICKRNNLKGEIQQSQTGSHIVFKVGDVWVKLMAPMFKHDMKFELAGLRSIASLAGFDRPLILFEGELEDWFYVGLSHVPGIPIRDCWDSFDKKSKLDMARQIANLVSNLGACVPDPIVASRFDWNPFIENQKLKARELHTQRELGKDWTDGLDSFLNQFPIEDFQNESPVFMHSDLQSDHLLIQLGDRPQLSGIIDLADCQTGHPDYELSALMVFVFKEDADVIREFLKNLKRPSHFPVLTSERIMAWCMVHRYFALAPLFGHIMAEVTPGDFNSLARRIFPL